MGETYPAMPADQNFLPDTPSSIAVSPPSQITDGDMVMLSWSRASDPNGDALTYEVTAEYTQKNGNPENDVVYLGSDTSYMYRIPSGKYKSVRFKVRSKDSKGAFSVGYAYTDNITIIENNPPTSPSNISATLTK